MPYTCAMEDGPEPIHLIRYVASSLESFEERSFCEVDALVLAEVAALHLEGLLPGLDEEADQPPIVLRDLLRADWFDIMFQGFPAERSWRFLSALAGSPRFGRLRVRWPEGTIDEGRSEQFAALTLSQDGLFDYVSFRGTDGSMAGWRENFMMAYRFPVPAQADAARYLERVAARTRGPLYVGGHSKGGNLAVYASAKATDATRARVRRVYDFDGPGFRTEAVSPSEYARIARRVEKFVPEESMVGLVMDPAEDLRVVCSDGHGLEQHCTFRWHIDPHSHGFVMAPGLADGSDRWRRALSDWMKGYSDEELEETADALFAAIEASENGAGEILEEGVQGIVGLLGSARTINEEQRKVLASAIASLRGSMVRAARDDIVDSVSQRYRGAVSRVSTVAGGVWELATGTEEEKARLREAHEARLREWGGGEPQGAK